MSKSFFIFTFLVFPLLTYAQNPVNPPCDGSIIQLKNVDGILFDKKCDILYEGYDNRMNLSIQEIEEAEIELIKQINNTLASDTRVKGNFQIKNPVRHFKKYKRQYFGYIDDVNQDKIVFINLLNFSGIGTPKRFKDWKEYFTIGFGEFYEKRTANYLYNLNTKTILIP
ncbi:MAG: hypothetical protein OEX22_05300 [Cyclobacteriaceae bacterium]|nr:hypothetical protein [Cyclobacteriaceae bacterium]